MSDDFYGNSVSDREMDAYYSQVSDNVCFLLRIFTFLQFCFEQNDLPLFLSEPSTFKLSLSYVTVVMEMFVLMT